MNFDRSHLSVLMPDVLNFYLSKLNIGIPISYLDVQFFFGNIISNWEFQFYLETPIQNWESQFVLLEIQLKLGISNFEFWKCFQFQIWKYFQFQIGNVCSPLPSPDRVKFGNITIFKLEMFPKSF